MNMRTYFSHVLAIVLAMTLTNVRDPFFLPQKAHKTNPLKNVKLLGIMTSNNKLGAIVEHNNRQKIIFAGNKINNYTVKNISKKGLTLTHKTSQEQISLNIG